MFDSINLDLLTVFTVVAESKSINKSSESLLLSQPAISKKIKQLEDFSNAQLLIRSSKGVTLTPEGEVLYQKAKKILKEFSSLHNLGTVKTFNDLNIGSLDSVASSKFPKFFVDSLSKVNRTVLTNKISELVEPFNDGNLDVIIMDSLLREKLIRDYEEVFLFKEPCVAVFSNKNNKMDLYENTLSMDELQNYELLMYPKYCPIHQHFVHSYKQLGVTLPTIFEVDYSESTIAFVANSDFLTILPKSLALTKVTNSVLNLSMKELEHTFTRNVSVFSNKSFPISEFMKHLSNIDNN